MKTNEIAIKVDKIDWLEIIRLALAKKDWGKKYTLFSKGKTILTCIMTTFNFEENSANFKLELSYENKNYWWSYRIVEYKLNNFTIEDFTMHLNKSIKSLVKECGREELKCIAKRKYSDMEYFSWKLDEDDMKGYENELEALENLETSMAEDLISNLRERIAVELNEPYKLAVDEYVENNKYTIEHAYDIIDMVDKKQ